MHFLITITKEGDLLVCTCKFVQMKRPNSVGSETIYIKMPSVNDVSFHGNKVVWAWLSSSQGLIKFWFTCNKCATLWVNCFNFRQVLLQHQGSIDILGHIQCSGLQPLLTALLVNVLPPSFKKATLTGLDHSVLGNSVFFFFSLRALNWI